MKEYRGNKYEKINNPQEDVYFCPKGDTGIIIIEKFILCATLKIKAGWSIEAGGSIEAGRWIKAGGSIEAGEWIKAGRWIFSFYFNISASYIITKYLPFWREYWANMKPLKKWEQDILDMSNCWNDMRKLPTKDEAIKICNWSGWHWILRAQLEMFFGIKEKYIIAPTPEESE